MPDIITAFPWLGGKSQRVKWIRTLMPEGPELKEQHYIEPYAGALTVLLNRPRAHCETIGDVNNGIVDFFKCMRDHKDEFLELLEWTPYSREEFARCINPVPGDTLENARRFIVRIRQAVRAREGKHVGNWDAPVKDVQPSYGHWRAFIEGPNFDFIHKRLQNVHIDSRDAFDTIQKFDSKHAMFYVDPPYLPDTYRTKQAYAVGDMTREHHFELCYILSNCQGKVAISGYDHPDYDAWLAGFTKNVDDKDRVLIGSGGINTGSPVKKREAVWTNFTIQQRMLFDMDGAGDDQESDDEWDWEC